MDDHDDNNNNNKATGSLAFLCSRQARQSWEQDASCHFAEACCSAAPLA